MDEKILIEIQKRYYGRLSRQVRDALEHPTVPDVYEALEECARELGISWEPEENAEGFGRRVSIHG